MASDVTQIHEERETLAVDVYLPGHAPRVTTPLFSKTRKELLAQPDAACFICNVPHTHDDPLEAHHHPIERAFAEMIDFAPGSAIRAQFPTFDWAAFDAAGGDPYLFVDDMRVNGLLLCKAHHIGKDEGIHALPFPVWIAQRFGRDGYKFSDVEVIHHVGAVK